MRTGEGHGRAGVTGKIRFPQRGWLFDLDGTIYLDDSLIPGADAVIAALRAAGRRVAFLSNKPLQTREDYARKLTRLGIPTGGDEVITSSLVLDRHLATLDPGAPVFVIGEPPLIAELAAHGFETRSDHRVRWVVIAFDRTFDYAKLNTALQAVRGGAAHRDQSRPHVPDARGRDPRLRRNDCRGRGRHGAGRRGRGRQALVDHPRRGAGDARRDGGGA